MHKRTRNVVRLLLVSSLLVLQSQANTGVHTSWLWHLHQPNYWPDQAPADHAGDHYQNAWDTMQLQDGGFIHPTDAPMRTIFGNADRIAAYQYGPKNTLQAISGALNSGVQLNYSGALMENIQSLAQHSQYYGTDWYTHDQTAHSWLTTGGKTRMDLTTFTYHHALASFVSDETLEMELRIHQRHQQILWNVAGQVSRGYFPTETCFSERLIPILNKVGIVWSVVANNHLSRSCADFPNISGSGGENCDIPNKADQLNPAVGASNYQRLSIDRGCSPTAAMPFAYQLHYARYVNPNTGAESKIVVVPADQAFGWKDSYSGWDVNLIDPIRDRNNPSKPCFVMMAHDGDNAWSGGFSYYNEWVPNFTSQVQAKGYEPSTVEQFMSEFPPDSNDVVHVEDGGWAFADSDFGSPMMINWHYPPSYPTNIAPFKIVDPSKGVSDKADAWRVIIATENRVKTAQQISGITPAIDQVRDPGSFSGTPNGIELGWHYYLAGLDSGFVYFGCVADECWRPVLAQSNAVRNVDSYINANPNADATPPTVFIPQRHPWNPGTTNFGVQYSYQVYVPSNTDFWVWTYAYDVSGITNTTLHYRSNGNNPPTQDQFKTYAGGANTGPWIQAPMTQRSLAPQNTVLPPKYIADYYHAKVTGLSDTYVDYYVSATDAKGNTYNSPIQHVYVAINTGAPLQPPAVPANVTTTAVATNQINVAWAASSGASLYYVSRGGNLAGTTAGTTFQDTGLAASSQYCYSVIASNSVGASVGSTPVCATTFTPPPPNFSPPFVIDGVSVDSTNYLQSSPGMTIYAAVRGPMLYVATWSPGNYPGDNSKNDHFVIVTDQLSATLQPAFPTWSKVGQNAVLSTKPFLGGESINNYVGWQNTTASNQCAKAALNSGIMEGVINLVEAFGSMPSAVYLCSAAYTTTNGGYLVAQAPAGSGPNIETNEFMSIPIAALLDNNGDGVYDRLDPSKDFVINSIQPADGGGFTVTWAAVPGKTYQVMYCDAFGAGWQNLPGAQYTAAAGQLSLTHTDNTAGNQRYYKVGLVP